MSSDVSKSGMSAPAIRRTDERPADDDLMVRCGTGDTGVLADLMGRRLLTHTLALTPVGRDWVHYYQLQAWMYPIVETLVTTIGKYTRVAEIVKEANRVIT